MVYGREGRLGTLPRLHLDLDLPNHASGVDPNDVAPRREVAHAEAAVPIRSPDPPEELRAILLEDADQGALDGSSVAIDQGAGDLAAV